MYHQIHATAIEYKNIGLLLIGKSGSGKSDFAFRFIQKYDNDAHLIADDRVDIIQDRNQLLLAPPESISGLIELRGIGIISLPWKEKIPLHLCVNLKKTYPRFPDKTYQSYLQFDIPEISLNPFENSADVKLKLILEKELHKK